MKPQFKENYDLSKIDFNLEREIFKQQQMLEYELHDEDEILIQLKKEYAMQLAFAYTGPILELDYIFYDDNFNEISYQTNQQLKKLASALILDGVIEMGVFSTRDEMEICIYPFFLSLYDEYKMKLREKKLSRAVCL